MRIALALAILLFPFLAFAQEAAASLTGAVVASNGAYIAKASVDLVSGTKKYQTQTDDAGVFKFSKLPEGEYSLTFQVQGFRRLTVKSILLSDDEQKRIPDITITVGYPCGGELDVRDFVRPLLAEVVFGRLSGNVLPPVADVEVTLVCRTFSACASTKTDSTGRFSFDMVSAGVYGLNFHREGFYPVNATGYTYFVNAGLESVYRPELLEQCPNGNCDPKLRPPPPIQYCE